MSSVVTPLMTAKAFAALPEPADGSKQELVRGKVVTTPIPGFQHGLIQATIAATLHNFVLANGVGRVTVETGFQTECDPDSVRGPEVAFWSKERIPLEITPQGYPDVAPDLCVEVLSPGDATPAMITKIREYLTRGVRLVWVVDPEQQTVTIYRKPGEGRVVWDDATLTGEDVLPGFTCPVAELFA